MKRLGVHFVALASLDLRLPKDVLHPSILNDEAAQCPELETFAAVHRIAGYFIFVGDLKQLCCLPQSRVAGEAGLEMSSFERFFEDVPSRPAVMLVEPRRMRKRLCEWISKRFYKSLLYWSSTAASQDRP